MKHPRDWPNWLMFAVVLIVWVICVNILFP